jgi:Cof subfamily protein (haloacid dehalogenase superfamily)
MSAIRLVALDIDGTLLPPGARPDALPDDQLTAAVRELVSTGVHVVLASGRMFPGTARIGRHLGLTTPLVCQQGAAVHQPDGSLLHRFHLDTSIAHALVDYATEHDWPYAWFDAVRYVASRVNQASVDYGYYCGVEPEFRGDARDCGLIPTGIDVISNADQATLVHRDLEDLFGERVHLLDFPTVTAAHSPEASKGKALALLAADLGVRQDEVMAIGDSVNDVSMLLWAGRGITLPHCDRYARQAADEILKGEGVSGVTQLLRSLVGHKIS